MGLQCGVTKSCLVVMLADFGAPLETSEQIRVTLQQLRNGISVTGHFKTSQPGSNQNQPL